MTDKMFELLQCLEKTIDSSNLEDWVFVSSVGLYYKPTFIEIGFYIDLLEDLRENNAAVAELE